MGALWVCVSESEGVHRPKKGDRIKVSRGRGKRREA